MPQAKRFPKPARIIAITEAQLWLDIAVYPEGTFTRHVIDLLLTTGKPHYTWSRIGPESPRLTEWRLK